jgi:hypothetical protein
VVGVGEQRAAGDLIEQAARLDVVEVPQQQPALELGQQVRRSR